MNANKKFVVYESHEFNKSFLANVGKYLKSDRL